MIGVLLLVAPPVARAAPGWSRPVDGEVLRPFRYAAGSPFAAEAHRGADLAAPPGTRVVSACPGRVLFAGAVASAGRVVTVACGGRRVTYLPLAGVAVHAGTRVAQGSPIGTVAAGHGGLHLGVRRARDRFAYEDPMPLLQAGRVPTPVLLPRVRLSHPRRPALRRGPSARVSAPGLRAVQVGAASARRTAALRAPAPWPVWAGVALVLAGCGGSGAAIAVGRRRTVRRAHVTVARSAG
jgi:murein DD-endopeptidase MepM/ murein hydrolase activator NlpD